MWEALISLRDGWMASDSDPRTELYLVWGIQDNDYQNTTVYDFATPACDDFTCGAAVYDSRFDPSPPDMQEYLADICEEAAGFDPTFIYDQSISHCLMKDSKAWLAESSIAFPIENEDDFWDKLYLYLRAPTDDEDAGDGYAYVQRELTRIGGEGTRRMYFLISAVETIFDPALFYSPSTIQPPRDAAYAFEAEWNAKKPKGATDFFVSTSAGLFTSMRMQQAYVSSTFTGVALALGLAFAALLVFVANVVIALVALVCIAAVVTCTLGVMVMLGWSLGPIEAIWCAHPLACAARPSPVHP
jgi:hypothetical protein